MLPFTHQQFIFVFTLYNGAIWPLQPLVHVAGIVMLLWLMRPSRACDRASVALLAAMWIWTGVVYQIGFFSRINALALAFGALFALEGVLLLEAALRGRLAFGSTKGWRRTAGWALLVYTLLIYPLLGLVSGRNYFDLPAFGVTPCPVTLTTIGVLLLATPPLPRRLYVIPAAWTLVGGSAALLLGMPQDWALLLAFAVLAAAAWIDRGAPRQRSTGAASAPIARRPGERKPPATAH